MINWKFVDNTNTVANRTFADGSFESRLVSALSSEDLATVLPADPIAAQPDGAGFVEALKIALGGIVAISSLPNAAIFYAAVKQGDWADVQALVVDANTKALISPTQYAGIKAVAAQFSIPLTLP